MRKSKYTEEQIIGFFRQAEAGMAVAQICRKGGFSDATFYKWRAKFGGMEVSEAKRLRELDAENAKLKHLLAEAHLDMHALKSVLGAKNGPKRQAGGHRALDCRASAALVPAHSGAGHSRISLLCLGSTQPHFFDGEGFGRFRLGARLLAAELHDWWLARFRLELIVKARIAPADLELLRHEHQDHSSKRIAAELHVSKSSMNSRFQRMNM